MAALNPVEITNFTGGLITDANPMSYPANASLDEYNMLINQDGTRSRRPGMDFEDGYSLVDTGVLTQTIDGTMTYRTFKWNNVAGVPDLTFVIVQIGSYLGIHATADGTPSDNLLYDYDLGVVEGLCSFASVDGILVVATGSQELLAISYDPHASTFEATPYRLLVRDTFGVEDILDGVDYREGSNISKRPKSITDAHAYNLRNQTFALPRLIGGPFVEYRRDPIQAWKDYSVTNFPSNADSVLDALFPNTASNIDPTTNRFNPIELGGNPPGTFSAPMGYFIIDALARGDSRIAEINKLHQDKELLAEIYKPTSLPRDYTPKGANCLAQFAGRMFYAGFTNEVEGGDANSPHMGSYVLFSKLVENYKDLKMCHQVGDPTSKNYSELLDTDGGFVKLEGAYNIQAMVALPAGLAVLAENGVWLIQGEDRGQFKATSYSTSKVSPNGCDSPSSAIVTGDGFMFWSRDGIYKVSPNQFGDLTVENMTKGKIQRFYSTISTTDRRYVTGVLDKYDRKAKWVYGNRITIDNTSKELVYSFDFDSFTVNNISSLFPEADEDYNTLPIIVLAPVVMPAFSATTVDVPVYVGSDLVLISTDEDVAISEFETVDSLTETKYLTLARATSNSILYTFSSYSNEDHYDWVSYSEDDLGVDAESSMLTGWVGGGDFQRNKQAPFLMMHFFKTETGFEEIDPEDPNTDWRAVDPSSCLVQSQWNWANHINSGKWGTPFQTYRFSRFWTPELVTDSFDNGFYTVETRNKLRGSGKVLSLKFTSEPGKHMNIIGWSLMIQGRPNV